MPQAEFEPGSSSGDLLEFDHDALNRRPPRPVLLTHLKFVKFWTNIFCNFQYFRLVNLFKKSFVELATGLSC